MNMEIVSIEKKTFEMMVAAFGALSEKVAALRRKSDTGRMERWLTGEEVCGQLRISPRTLQTLRPDFGNDSPYLFTPMYEASFKGTKR